MPIVDRVLQRVVGSTLRSVLHNATSLSSTENGIHLDFSTGTYYTKVAGQDAVFEPLTSMFTFTGGNQSMYVGPSGLLVQSATNQPRVEYASTTIGTNLLLHSQTLNTGATWPMGGWTVQADAAIAPDGTQTAEVFTENTAGGVHSIDQTIAIVAAQQYTFSVYAKSPTRGIVIKFRDVTDSNGVVAAYNLQTGGNPIVPGLYGSATGVSGSITPVGDGWYRVRITGTLNGGFTSAVLSLRGFNGSEGYTGDGASQLTLWGAQFEMGGVATQYTPTTSTVPAYTNSPPTCLGLLMEASRTNLCLQSETLGTTWVPAGATVSSNLVNAPDGASTADALVEDGTTGAHGISQGFVKAASALTYTFSGWLKSNGRTLAQLRISGVTTADRVAAEIDLAAGTITVATAFGTFTAAASTIVAYPNGWYRFTLTGTTNTDTSLNTVILMESSSGITSYTGNSASGMYFWGAQLEQAAFASSYIPTTTVSVARTADSCIRAIGSEFSATAGTVVVAGRASGGQEPALGQSVWEFNNNTAAERWRQFRAQATDTNRTQVVVASAALGNMDAGSFTNSGAFKSAAAYANNDYATSFNGGAVQTLAVAVPTLSHLNLGMSINAIPMNGHILRFDYYPKRETNGFLQRASTL